jgi:hypothetical protein
LLNTSMFLGPLLQQHRAIQHLSKVKKLPSLPPSSTAVRCPGFLLAQSTLFFLVVTGLEVPLGILRDLVCSTRFGSGLNSSSFWMMSRTVVDLAACLVQM